jgi:hypothetical protein
LAGMETARASLDSKAIFSFVRKIANKKNKMAKLNFSTQSFSCCPLFFFHHPNTIFLSIFCMRLLLLRSRTHSILKSPKMKKQVFIEFLFQ